MELPSMLSAAEETQGSTNMIASMWASALRGAFPSFLELSSSHQFNA
jgi:hypothetical protein